MFGNIGGDSVVFEDNYREYREDFRELVSRRGLSVGSQIQDGCLHDTDEDALTERERFIMILAVIKIEMELDVLTPELKDELYFYVEDWNNGKFEGLLGDDEIDDIKTDLFECYEKVFG